MPDRRKPTASDRAVERIRTAVDLCVQEGCRECDIIAKVVQNIIREEAERNE